MTASIFRPRGMSDAAFDDWVKSLVIVGDEAYFAPDSPHGDHYNRASLKTCRRCGETYAHGTYSEHVESHDDGPRTRQWRETARTKRILAARRRAA